MVMSTRAIAGRNFPNNSATGELTQLATSVIENRPGDGPFPEIPPAMEIALAATQAAFSPTNALALVTGRLL